MGKGAFKALLHCFTASRDARRDRRRAGALRLVLGRPDVQELAGPARHRPRPCRSTGCWWRPTRRSWRRRRIAASRNEPAYVAETAKVLGDRQGPERRRHCRKNDGKCSATVRQNAGGCLREPSLTILGCGSSGRRAARWRRMGRVRSGKPEEPPPALLHPCRADIGRRRARRVLVDTVAGPARPAPRGRHEAARRRFSSPIPTPTTPTASTTCARW